MSRANDSGAKSRSNEGKVEDLFSEIGRQLIWHSDPPDPRGYGNTIGLQGVSGVFNELSNYKAASPDNDAVEKREMLVKFLEGLIEGISRSKSF